VCVCVCVGVCVCVCLFFYLETANKFCIGFSSFVAGKPLFSNSDLGFRATLPARK